MAEIDTFGTYVRRRLDAWGEEFALHRNCVYLGHPKNVLQTLIEHRGEIPKRPAGFKPLEVDLLALQVEQIVHQIGRDRVQIACALRGYYCGHGRRKIERYETALLLMDAAGVRCKPTARQYLDLIRLGEAEVRASLRIHAQAA